MLVTIYVDDIVIAYSDFNVFKSFRNKLMNPFMCKVLGTLADQGA